LRHLVGVAGIATVERDQVPRVGPRSQVARVEFQHPLVEAQRVGVLACGLGGVSLCQQRRNIVAGGGWCLAGDARDQTLDHRHHLLRRVQLQAASALAGDQRFVGRVEEVATRHGEQAVRVAVRLVEQRGCLQAGDPVLHHLLVAGALAVEHQQVGAVRGSFGVAGFQLEHALERRASSGCAGCVGVHQPPAL